MNKYIIILFDIDHTLVDTDRVKKMFKAQVSKISEKSLNEINTIEKGYLKRLPSSSFFNPKDFLDILNIDIKNFPLEKIYKKTTFPDVYENLMLLKKSFRMGIYSEGDRNLQENKLRYSGIMKFFEREYIFISKNKTAIRFIRKLPSQSIIVDDKLKVLDSVSKRTDILPLHINRGNIQKSTKFLTVNRLEDIYTTVNSLTNNYD